MSAVDDFLRKVLKSGLLQRDELQMALRTLAKERREDVGAVADHLTAARKLTKFQLHKIQQGITVGLVLGPYHLLVPLGRGGMGTVYLARDSRTGEHVALKILPPRIARTEERLLVRFQREMALSQKVNHPHLARAREVGVFQGVHYIAMEYIPGRTLYRAVAGGGPLSVARTAHLFAEVASALALAHSRGIIHRDMKPSNIMVTPHDHAKVLDLGLAFTEGEAMDDIEVVGGKGYIVGSIDYMAPEQTRDPTNIDVRADLYALGCCMYFSLSGKPPFPEGTIYEKVKAHRHSAPELINAKNPQVPGAFAELVHRLLAKAPVDRFASAAQLEAALDSWRDRTAQTLDTPGDAEAQRALREVIDGWTVPEPMKEALETQNDAVIFRIDPEERPAAAEPSGSIFRDIDRIPPHWWLLGFAALWVGLLFLCGVGACLIAVLR